MKALVAGYGAGKTYAFLKETLKQHIVNIVPEKGISNGWIVYPTLELARDLFIDDFKDLLEEKKIKYSFSEKQLTFRSKYGKIKIRKGLPSSLPYEIQELLFYGLLHDFFHTVIHKSKIYLEPQLENQSLVDLLRQSHSDNSHLLIETFKKYDGIASYLTRRYKAPRTTRYNWKTSDDFQLIDFDRWFRLFFRHFLFFLFEFQYIV